MLGSGKVGAVNSRCLKRGTGRNGLSILIRLSCARMTETSSPTFKSWNSAGRFPSENADLSTGVRRPSPTSGATWPRAECLCERLQVHYPVAWTGAFRRADDISEKHAATEGQRTIDLLHVALALECGAKTFLSFDTRQRKLAKAAGLKVKP